MANIGHSNKLKRFISERSLHSCEYLPWTIASKNSVGRRMVQPISSALGFLQKGLFDFIPTGEMGDVGCLGR